MNIETQYNHNFLNKHTALGILILIVGCFFAGYFVGHNSVKPVDDTFVEDTFSLN